MDVLVGGGAADGSGAAHVAHLKRKGKSERKEKKTRHWSWRWWWWCLCGYACVYMCVYVLVVSCVLIEERERVLNAER